MYEQVECGCNEISWKIGKYWSKYMTKKLEKPNRKIYTLIFVYKTKRWWSRRLGRSRGWNIRGLKAWSKENIISMKKITKKLNWTIGKAKIVLVVDIFSLKPYLCTASLCTLKKRDILVGWFVFEREIRREKEEQGR